MTEEWLKELMEKVEREKGEVVAAMAEGQAVTATAKGLEPEGPESVMREAREEPEFAASEAAEPAAPEALEEQEGVPSPEEGMEPTKEEKIANMKAWIKDIVIALVIGILIIQFVKPTIVKEHSMMPTLNENNYLFVSRQAYTLFGDPEYGDIIVFHSELKRENGKEKLLIKRVIGMPGDTLDIMDGVVYRNGEALEEPYLMEQYTSGYIEGFVVPQEQLFVMGDNRQNSADSRDSDVGCVDFSEVMGKAVFRLLPISQIGSLYEE